MYVSFLFLQVKELKLIETKYFIQMSLRLNATLN